MHARYARPLSIVLLAATAWLCGKVQAADTLAIERVADGIYALIGSTGARSADNDALNANFGVIDTPEGAILIDSGASALGAAKLDALARQLTGKPVRWVLNTGSQDHRWLGNAYFADRGAELIALARTADTQTREAGGQLESLRRVLGAQLDGTRPQPAAQPRPGDLAALELGGRRIELRYFADAHFPGDAVVWLPDVRVAFAGDHVYTDRLLGVLPQSNAQTWKAAFEALLRLDPQRIVPGHGRVADAARARADTGDYLAFLVEGARPLAAELAGVDQAVAALGEAPSFKRLANYDELHRANVSRAYLRFEAAQ